MKKLVIALSILILLSGCAQQIEKPKTTPAVLPPAAPVVEAPVVEEPVVEEPVVDEPKPVANETAAELVGENMYKMKLNTKYKFNGVELEAMDIDSSSAQFRVEVNGNQILFVGTKEVEIAEGFEMFVDSFGSFGTGDPRTYVTMSVKPFKLGENEYLVRRGTPITLPDVNKTQLSVTGTKIDSADVRTVNVNLAGDVVDIVQGREAYLGKYIITNLKTFNKDKSYALLKVVLK